ncbi:PAS domain S-box protein [Bordetella flabilis]|uniref:histidine kinase n=1 Tax=Bordetella flabilis TaxID=463014 RepID=A0A193GAL1_9BORD|nr:PAS domain S-box protein [Bordetella flabilis]ANN76309.1 hybrid sensor histidine kinase/response regulator [Bordetella flabilis]
MSRQEAVDKRPPPAHDFRRLVESIQRYAVYMVSPDGVVLSWNAGARQLTGWDAVDIVGRHYSEAYERADQATTDPTTLLDDAKCKSVVVRDGFMRRKGGSQVRVSTTVDPVRDDDGTLLGFAFVSCDVADIDASDEALRRSEEQFQLLMRGVVDYAIYMLDRNGHVTTWNAGAERIKGYSREEILGSHFSRFYTDNDREAGVPAQALQAALREGRYEREAWRVRKDGTLFYAHVVIDPVFDPDNNHVGFAKVTRDITEKQAAKEELERTQRALQQAQKLETIGKLTGGVAHDFNNLLQVIGGNLQLLASDIQDTDRAKKRLANAFSGVQRGAKLASHLLAFGRRQPLDPSVVNIRTFLRGFDDMLRRSLGEAIEVETIVAGGLWNTMIDAAQLENALLNLAINARDAMNGVGKLTIEIGNAYLDDAYARTHPEVKAGQYVMLAVTDTGSGMASDVMAQAVEPFFSTKPEGQGTGLGLSMVYGFVKQSGGHLALYSELGHGTTVRLYLPRSFEKEDVGGDSVPIPIAGGSETILVAEDDEQVCTTVVELLRGLGYQVLRAGDGESAFAIIASGIKIDLLFTDVVMPGPLRSPDLARKAQERQPDMAVLFTSGYTQNAIVHGGRLDKGVELIAKPYTREDLARKVRHVIANHKHRRNGLRGRAEPAAPVPPVQSAARQLTILLVDDDEDVRTITAAMLETLGHVALEAADANAAFAALDEKTPDLMLVDVGLQGMSGIELANEVKKKWPGVGIVYATGQDAPSDSAPDMVLRKPYSTNEIVQVLKPFLKMPNPLA